MMSPGEFVVVLSGGCVGTFLVVSMIEMIRKGTKRRERERLEAARDANALAAGPAASLNREPAEPAPVERSSDSTTR